MRPTHYEVPAEGGKLAALPWAARKRVAALPLFAAPCRSLNPLKPLIHKEMQIWHAPC
jgi:hypothetical protein